MEKYKLLVFSDDYDNYLYKHGVYQDKFNYHDNEPIFELTIESEFNFNIIQDYDIVVFDYGMIEKLDQQGLYNLNKIKNLFVTSAMPENYIRGEGCSYPYVDFRMELMYIDLINHLKGVIDNG